MQLSPQRPRCRMLRRWSWRSRIGTCTRIHLKNRCEGCCTAECCALPLYSRECNALITPKAAKPNMTTRKLKKSHRNMYAYTSAVTRAPGSSIRLKNRCDGCRYRFILKKKQLFKNLFFFFFLSSSNTPEMTYWILIQFWLKKTFTYSQERFLTMT